MAIRLFFQVDNQKEIMVNDQGATFTRSVNTSPVSLNPHQRSTGQDIDRVKITKDKKHHDG